MAVWVDPAIEFIVREAHQDMGSSYAEDPNDATKGLRVVPLLTEETKLMALVWNEGEIEAVYNMEQQGVYVAVKFEPQIIGYQKRQVGRALYDFENALIGSPLNPEQEPAHHNVGGHPIREEDMGKISTRPGEPGISETIKDIYEPLTRGRPGGDRADGKWWPEHIVQKLTIEGLSIKYDPVERFWRGRLYIHAHIANAGFGGIS